jgi:hypothetical protein
MDFTNRTLPAVYSTQKTHDIMQERLGQLHITLRSLQMPLRSVYVSEQQPVIAGDLLLRDRG